MTDQEQLVIAYLKDEAKLYHDWYQTLSPEKDDTMRQVAKMPPLEELIIMGRNWSRQWFEKNRQALQTAIHGTSFNCENWKRIRTKPTYEWGTHLSPHFLDKLLEIVGIDLLSTVIVLIINGLFDWICGDLEPDYVM